MEFRRFAIAFVTLAALAASAQAPSLRQAADQAAISIGTLVRPAQLSDAAYASTLARKFNMVEAEDARQWWVLRPDANAYDFRQGYKLVRFALAHGMKVRAGVVWCGGGNNPDWLGLGCLSKGPVASSRFSAGRTTLIPKRCRFTTKRKGKG